MSPDVSWIKVLREAMSRPAGVRPPAALPSVRSNLKELNSEVPVVIWFGHSSYLIHCRGINILVDPVFSGHASPFPFMIKAFPGSDIYKPEDLPVIDVVIITHNHYDHLDKGMIRFLSSRARSFYTSLGVGKSLQSFSVDDSLITELDWWEQVRITADIQLTATPARHFSGRGIKRAGSLWSSFVLELFGYSIYLGGDSGYDDHFKMIGAKHGPFHLAILECGQYNTSWPLIHMMPEEAVQASIDLKAEVFMPVHWAKFILANHDWNEPVKRAFEAAHLRGVRMTTPRIGEPVYVGERYPAEHWWDL
jgi:L-ascorbate metabolism protein UlaG (beta-lactamase superfamily)